MELLNRLRFERQELQNKVAVRFDIWDLNLDDLHDDVERLVHCPFIIDSKVDYPLPCTMTL